jgi:hypothetical protein
MRAEIPASRNVDAEQWERFAEGLVAESGTIKHRVVKRYRRELPAYGALDAAEVFGGFEESLAEMLRILRARGLEDPEHTANIFRSAGERRARAGIPVEELLQTGRIVTEEVRAMAEKVAPDGPQRDAIILQMVDVMLAWGDLAMIATAEGHRRAELEAQSREAHEMAVLVRAMLFGGLSPAQLCSRANAYGLDADSEFYAFRARPTEAISHLAIGQLLGTGRTAGRRNGLASPIEGDLSGVLNRLPTEPLPVSIGVAGPHPLNELQAGFRTASRALDTAVSLGMPGIHDIASLGLFPAVIADPTVGDALQARYVTPLAERGEAGDTILDTVASYLDLRCRLGDTASALYVHPNTVRYRLGRFESLTDCSLQDTRVLAEVWWALQRRRLSLPGAGDRGPDRTAI